MLSINRLIFAKTVLCDRNAAEKWGSGGLPTENVFVAMPSRTPENALSVK